VARSWVHRLTIQNNSATTAFWIDNLGFDLTDTYVDNLADGTYAPSGQPAFRVAAGEMRSIDIFAGMELKEYVLASWDLYEDNGGIQGDDAAATTRIGHNLSPELSSTTLLLIGMLPVGLVWWRRRKIAA
jgi:hypothetical protein